MEYSVSILGKETGEKEHIIRQREKESKYHNNERK